MRVFRLGILSVMRRRRFLLLWRVYRGSLFTVYCSLLGRRRVHSDSDLAHDA